MEKIAFLGFDQFQGRQNIGSSRIRCDWPIRYWPEAERFKNGRAYDVLIYQKAYFIDHAKIFKGIKILDLCDPDWLDPGCRFIEMLDLVDAVSCSSLEMSKFIANLTDKPVWCIPDRIDLNAHREKKEHSGRATKVVWFGYSHNFLALTSALKPILDLKLQLIVISNSPFHPPASMAQKLDLINYGYNSETINADLLKGDIMVNPKLNNLKFRFKSNNKTLTAWALGLPVADDDRQLKKFLDPEERQQEAGRRLEEIKKDWNVELSVRDYKNLIAEIKKNNNNYV